MTSVECSTSARNRSSLARSASAARRCSVTSRAIHTTRSSPRGDTAALNQASCPPMRRRYSWCTVSRRASARRSTPKNSSACGRSKTSWSVLPSSSGAGRYRRPGLVGAILTYRPAASSTRITSLIAANSAWSSASDSPCTGGALPGIVMAAAQYSPTGPPEATAPRGGCDAHHVEARIATRAPAAAAARSARASTGRAAAPPPRIGRSPPACGCNCSPPSRSR